MNSVMTEATARVSRAMEETLSALAKEPYGDTAVCAALIHAAAAIALASNSCSEEAFVKAAGGGFRVVREAMAKERGAS